jgi:hypothetical protein
LKAPLQAIGGPDERRNETTKGCWDSHHARGSQSSFAHDAIVKGDGREVRDIAAIREWGERQMVLEVAERDGQTIVTTKIDGTFDRTGLPDPLLMDLAGDKNQLGISKTRALLEASRAQRGDEASMVVAEWRAQ